MAVGFIARVRDYAACSWNWPVPDHPDQLPSSRPAEDPLEDQAINGENFDEEAYKSYGRSIVQSVAIGTLTMTAAVELASTHDKTRQDVMSWRRRYFSELDSERNKKQKTTLEQAKKEARERLAEMPTRVITTRPIDRKLR